MSKNYELDKRFLEEIHKYFDIKTQNNITLYVCKLCEDTYSAFNTWTAVRHYDSKHSEEQRPKIEIKGKHPLKPWKDPESLFCDTEFLRKIIGKEPAKGDECRDTEKE